MAMAAPILMMVGAVVSAVGAIRQANARSDDMNAAADAATFNANVSEQNAQIALDQGRAEAAMQERDTRRRLGAIRANFGASGITPEGSPLDILASSAFEAEMDRQTILYDSELRARAHRTQSTLDTAESGNLRRGAKQAKSAGKLSAAGVLLGGAAKAYGSYSAGTPVKV